MSRIREWSIAPLALDWILGAADSVAVAGLLSLSVAVDPRVGR